MSPATLISARMSYRTASVWRRPTSKKGPASQADIQRPENNTDYHVEYVNLHELCTTSGRPVRRTLGTLDLSLLRVCKQVHQEAALLPFTLNKYIFPSVSHLAAFASSLLMARKLAVVNIESGMSLWYEYIMEEDKRRIAKLRGPRQLSLTLEDTDWSRHNRGIPIELLRARSQGCGVSWPLDYEGQCTRMHLRQRISRCQQSDFDTVEGVP